MKLLLRRDQKPGLLGGKITFTLSVRADLTPDEAEAIKRYKLGDTMLYARERLQIDENTFAGHAKFLFRHAMNLTIHVKDLANGKIIDCKDILEMMAAEEQVKEAAQSFVAMLQAAKQFGGEEVLEL
jgi:hypothetical protein